MCAAAVKAHTVILKAIRVQDEQSPGRRMERHVAAYRDVATGVAGSETARPAQLRTSNGA